MTVPFHVHLGLLEESRAHEASIVGALLQHRLDPTGTKHQGNLQFSQDLRRHVVQQHEKTRPGCVCSHISGGSSASGWLSPQLHGRCRSHATSFLSQVTKFSLQIAEDARTVLSVPPSKRSRLCTLKIWEREQLLLSSSKSNLAH